MTSVMKAALLHVDCMDYMAGLPDKAFDLAIVDPPYGIDFANERERKPTKTRSAQFKFPVKDWDRATPVSSYFLELDRVSKNQVIWGGNYFLDYLGKTNCVIIWDKLNPDGMKFSDGEMAWSSFETSLRIFKSMRTYMLESQIHPTQKPVLLYEWLLTNYAKPGQRILDTHLGSGSSAIACNNLGFEMVGCELDKDYYRAACARVEQATKQERLFA
jgi:site-specific DNA-methyltransferase (adenine-specific)